MRNIVLSILLKIIYEDQFSHIVIREELKKHPELEERDRRFVEKLSRGTLERRITLEAVVNRVSKTKVSKMKPVIACILYMGTYQLLFMETEDYAAINESVKLVAKRGLNGLKPFVNGVLRSISREGKALLKGLEPWQLYSMPEFLYKNIVSWYGQAAADQICSSFLDESRNVLTVRRNASRITEEDFMTLMNHENLFPHSTGITADTYFLKESGDLSVSECFRKGYFYVQDISSAIAGDVLSDVIREGCLVLDACAAPGGKSIHAADLLKDTGHVTACDLSEKKVRLIEENIVRSGFHNLTACLQDASVFRPEWENAFDIVICDAPCSGLGIIGRKPDIKYHVTQESLKSLHMLQIRILKNVMRYVKKGGILLYSTCTINPDENKGVLDVCSLQEFVPCPEEKFLGGWQKQLLPSGDYPGTGFFIARLKRV